MSRSVSQAEVARRAAMNGPTYERIENGGTKGISLKFRQPIADALEVDIPNLFAEIGAPIPDRAKPETPDIKTTPASRFAAIRHAYWGDDVENASRKLGITTGDLSVLENGRRPVTEDLILRLCGLTGCPLRFLTEGDVAGMPEVLAFRLGHFYPHMIPGLLG